MKCLKPIYSLFICFALSSCATSRPMQEIVYPQPVIKAPIISQAPATSATQTTPKQAKVYPLPLYEKLTYDLTWFGITVGTATATIKGVTTFNGREVYDLELRTESNSWLDKIYHIDSVYSSYMDVETLASLQEKVVRKEGRYRKDAVTTYNHDTQKASFHNKTDNSSFEFSIPKGVRDALTSIYYFRAFELNVNDQVAFDVVASEKNYKFKADVKDEKTLNLNGFEPQEAVYVKPYVVFEDENAKKGTVSGYFSKDSYHIPLYAVVQTPVFTKAVIRLRDVSYTKPSE